jgi:hypothetical protein
MITPGIAVLMGAVAFGLAVYSFYDNENRLYGNAVACGFSWIICFALAMMFTGGVVVEVGDPVVESSYLYNNSGNMTTVYSYSDAVQTPVVDSGLGYVFGIFGFIMLIYNALLVFDIVFAVQAERMKGAGRF